MDNFPFSSHSFNFPVIKFAGDKTNDDKNSKHASANEITIKK